MSSVPLRIVPNLSKVLSLPDNRKKGSCTFGGVGGVTVQRYIELQRTALPALSRNHRARETGGWPTDCWLERSKECFQEPFYGLSAILLGKAVCAVARCIVPPPQVPQDAPSKFL